MGSPETACIQRGKLSTDLSFQVVDNHSRYFLSIPICAFLFLSSVVWWLFPTYKRILFRSTERTKEKWQYISRINLFQKNYIFSLQSSVNKGNAHKISPLFKYILTQHQPDLNKSDSHSSCTNVKCTAMNYNGKSVHAAYPIGKATTRGIIFYY